MKLLSFLTTVTLLTSAAFWAALALDLGAVSLFDLATSVSVLLLAVGDYYPRRRWVSPSTSSRLHYRRAKYVLPMAA